MKLLNREEMVEKINQQTKQLRSDLFSRCKYNYPHKSDKEGWEMYGKLQALAWVKIFLIEGKW